jgi:ADP-ribosylglycohydrolase
MNTEISKELLSLIRYEIVQRREEGCDVEAIEEHVEHAMKRADGLRGIELYTVLQDLESLQPAESFPYVEPSTLDEIRAERPDGPRRMELNLTDAQMLDRIHGAWSGRAAGCALGKPVEGWHKRHINSYLQFAEALPLNDYIPLVEGHPEGLKLRLPDCTRGMIHYMARDDDMDYTILGLHLLERHGPDFTSSNVAETWLSRLPYHLVYTAERAAYRNLVNNLWPPESATHRNPFREWIGAQIRADMWGYVAPGWPEKAAEFAFRDAVVSHVKNGIYGEMFVAAMLAASFVTSDVEEVIRIGLSEIPRNSRLAEAVRDTVEWSKELTNWEQIWAKINEKYGHYHAVHTINNAALVVMGLMFAQRDYETSIVVAVRGGWDTDCNGATAGSVCGMMLGADALPSKWVGVLNDRLISAVRGFGECRISDLAKRSHEIAKKVTAEAR